MGSKEAQDYLSIYVQQFMPLLDRGWVLAFTQRRDSRAVHSLWSGDLTEAEVRKQLAVGDFINCVQHLLRDKYTCAGKLAIMVSYLCTIVAYTVLSCHSHLTCDSTQQVNDSMSHCCASRLEGWSC